MIPANRLLPNLVPWLGILTLPAGCMAPRQPEFVPVLWAAGPSERVNERDSPRARTICYSRERNAITLQGAVNETLGFEFVLSATSGPLAGLRLDAEDLVGPAGSIPRTSIRLYRHWPLVVERYENWYLRFVGLRERRAFPDALVPIDAPLHGQPFSLPTGESLPIWVEIRIPPATRPGSYAGGLLLRYPEDRRLRMPVELTVHDVFLDPANGIPILARVHLGPLIAAHTAGDPRNIPRALRDPDTRDTLLRAFLMLHDHGLSPYTDEVRPGFSQDVDGSIQIDWSEYDAFCGPLIDGSAYADARRAAAWPLPVDLAQPDPAQFDGSGSPFYTAVLKEYLLHCKRHFTEKGWLERAFVDFQLPFVASPGSDDLRSLRQLAGLVHLIDPEMRVVSALIPQAMAPFGWPGHRFEELGAHVDIWRTPARYQDVATLRRLQAMGKRIWLPPDQPPFAGSLCVEAPPIDARSLPWQAFLQAQDAIYIAQTTNWPDTAILERSIFDRPIRDREQPSDAWLLYPGRPFGLDGPVPSVRLKQLQLGLQDCRYLRLLAEHGRAETARLLAGSLIAAAGTEVYGDNYQDGLFGRRVQDAETWELARSLLVEETALTIDPRPVKPIDAGANRAAWAKFLADTRRIEILAEGSRMALVSRSEESPLSGRQRMGRVFTVSCDVAVRNGLRTPLEGTFELGPLPPNARALARDSSVGPLTERELARRTLLFEIPHLPPCDLDGHYEQKIAFDARTSGRLETHATVSAALVAALERPITVDGDLTDWPPNTFNVAGDFRLINDHPDAATRRARAQSQTVVYFGQRDDVLYIGLHAASPTASELESEPRRMRSEVEYDGLMPVGEDLVEVLIDPTNRATRSDDLFHVVLKSSGVALFERGIGVNPPIGEVAPWPAQTASHAVMRTDFGWSAEIGMALRSFGVASARGTVWGLNVTRLEPVRGEYSDWARAPRHCYDPRTLGNLIWPD